MPDAQNASSEISTPHFYYSITTRKQALSICQFPSSRLPAVCPIPSRCGQFADCTQCQRPPPVWESKSSRSLVRSVVLIRKNRCSSHHKKPVDCPSGAADNGDIGSLWQQKSYGKIVSAGVLLSTPEKLSTNSQRNPQKCDTAFLCYILPMQAALAALRQR